MPEDRLPPARHEGTDIPPKLIWAGFITLVGTLALMFAIVLLLFPKSTRDRVLTWPLPRFPNPELQASPSADLATFRTAELRQLNSAGWVDRAHGVVHMPIADAMREVAVRGIPGWPK